eukprot:PhM_4_TR6367/c0_g1_i2/m.70900
MSVNNVASIDPRFVNWRKRSTLSSGEAFTFSFDDLVLPAETQQQQQQQHVPSTESDANTTVIAAPRYPPVGSAASSEVQSIWGDVETIAKQFCRKNSTKSPQDHENDWRRMRRRVRMR